MDPFLWAYGFMASEAGDGAGARRRDRGRLLLYRAALGLTLVEARSLEEAGWSEGDMPSCSMANRLDILRALAQSARSQPDGWPDERRRLVSLAEHLGIPPGDCAAILIESAGPGPEAVAEDPGPVRPRSTRRTWLIGAVGAGALIATVAFGMDFLERRAQRERFAGFEERFEGALLLIEVECDLILGTGRVPYRSRGMGFFVSPDGLLATNKHVIQPWKFMPQLVRKLDNGYVLDEESVRIFAWRAEGLAPAEGGRFDDAAAFSNAQQSLEIVQITPDATTRRAVALPEGGVHRGVYHLLDRSDVVLLKARVAAPVPAIDLVTGDGAQEGDPVLALGLVPARRGARDKALRTVASPGRVYAGDGGTMRLTASVGPERSGGPVLDVDGRVIGIATHRPGDSGGSRCVPAGAIQDLIQPGG